MNWPKLNEGLHSLSPLSTKESKYHVENESTLGLRVEPLLSKSRSLLFLFFGVYGRVFFCIVIQKDLEGNKRC